MSKESKSNFTSAVGVKLTSMLLVLFSGGWIWLGLTDNDHTILFGVAAFEILLAVLLLLIRKRLVWQVVMIWLVLLPVWLGFMIIGGRAWDSELLLKDENTRLTLVLLVKSIVAIISLVLLGLPGSRQQFPAATSVSDDL